MTSTATKESLLKEHKQALEFLQAAEKGQLDVVKRALEKGAVNVNAQNLNGFTALMSASLQGHLHIVRVLLEHKASVSARSNNKNTALLYAATKGFDKIIHLLVENKADINATNITNDNALMWASMSGHNSVVKYLLTESQLSITDSNKDGLTALMCGTMSGSVETVSALLDHLQSHNQLDAHINSQNICGNTALHIAAEVGNVGVACLLAAHNASIGIANTSHLAPIELATSNEMKLVLRQLHEAERRRSEINFESFAQSTQPTSKKKKKKKKKKKNYNASSSTASSLPPTCSVSSSSTPSRDNSAEQTDNSQDERPSLNTIQPICNDKKAESVSPIPAEPEKKDDGKESLSKEEPNDEKLSSALKTVSLLSSSTSSLSSSSSPSSTYLSSLMNPASSSTTKTDGNSMQNQPNLNNTAWESDSNEGDQLQGLVDELHPRASLLDITPALMLKGNFNNLSISQLGALEEIYQRLLRDIGDAKFRWQEKQRTTLTTELLQTNQKLQYLTGMVLELQEQLSKDAP